jgi:hypothetical protein
MPEYLKTKCKLNLHTIINIFHQNQNLRTPKDIYERSHRQLQDLQNELK